MGLRLRELRRGAQLSGKQLAESLHWPQSKVSKLELGQQTPTPADVRAWAAATGADNQLDDLLASLDTLETQYAEWQRQFRGGAARRQRELYELAVGANVIRCFEPAVVPGLLQTAAYARCMLADVPNIFGAPDDVDEAVTARMRRQEMLYAPGKLFHFVITEAVLRYQSCPPNVFAGQLDRLLALISMPNARLGIIPFAGAYPVSPLHGFWIYDDKLVLVETFAAELNLAQRPEIQLYSRLYENLARIAVYTSAARSMVMEAIAMLPAPPMSLDELPLTSTGNT